VRRASAFPLALGVLILAPACYTLPHIDPGPRWIDEFNADAGMTPTWNVFTAWTCGTRQTPPLPQVGHDGAANDGGGPDARAPSPAPSDAGAADAGSPRMLCQTGDGALVQPFAFADTSNNVEFTAETKTLSGTTVDFTGFHQFVFSANLTTPSTAPLPVVGTVFQVELDCSGNQNESVLTQKVPDFMLNAQGLDPFFLDLAQFHFNVNSSTGSCLSQIDRIRFVVKPGQNDQPEVAGTLSLDNISLQN
jgi:hypothetical protein